MPSSDFLADVQLQIERSAPPVPPQITSLGYAWLVIGNAVMELRREIDKPVDQRTTLSARSQLIQIAALAMRAARDLGIESAADAAHQDIPF